MLAVRLAGAVPSVWLGGLLASFPSERPALGDRRSPSEPGVTWATLQQLGSHTQPLPLESANSYWGWTIWAVPVTRRGHVRADEETAMGHAPHRLWESGTAPWRRRHLP